MCIVGLEKKRQAERGACVLHLWRLIFVQWLLADVRGDTGEEVCLAIKFGMSHFFVYIYIKCIFTYGGMDACMYICMYACMYMCVCVCLK